VLVEGLGASFTGTVEKPTQLSACVHQSGEIMWRMTRSGDRYIGTHRWFNGNDCRPTTSVPGPATWMLTGTASSPVLHFCSTAPSGGQQKCANLSRTLHVVKVSSVSNGCGGEGLTKKGQNYALNTSIYAESATEKYTVNFEPACNLHDAGYSGAVVHDNLHGGVVVDFSTWSRRQVDFKFLQDMQFLCRRTIPDQARTALAKCLGNGGADSIGAASRYAGVRELGDAYFDANPIIPGVQAAGPRANN
jgi:hypothetical protein